MKMTKSGLRQLVKSVLAEQAGGWTARGLVLTPGQKYRLSTRSNEWTAEYVGVKQAIRVDSDSAVSVEVLWRDSDGTQWSAYVDSSGRLAFGSSGDVLQVDEAPGR